MGEWRSLSASLAPAEGGGLHRRSWFGRRFRPRSGFRSFDCPGPEGRGVYKCHITYDTRGRVRRTSFEPYRPRQVKTLTCMEMPGLDYSCKWEDRTGLLAAGAALGCDEEALILRNGMVTDTRYSNVVFGDGSSWVTPETFLLPGTKRAFLLSRGDIQECSVRAEDIGKFASVP